MVFGGYFWLFFFLVFSIPHSFLSSENTKSDFGRLDLFFFLLAQSFRVSLFLFLSISQSSRNGCSQTATAGDFLVKCRASQKNFLEKENISRTYT